MTPTTITLASETVAANQPIPRRHTEDGEDLSPPLNWSNVPEKCAEFALLVDDPDAPTSQPWVHWVIYSIPGGTSGLPEGIPRSSRLSGPVKASQGKNSWGTIGYRGPAPPAGHGVHHYHFKLYALDANLDLQPELDKQALLSEISGHVLAEGELIATYQR